MGEFLFCFFIVVLILYYQYINNFGIQYLSIFNKCLIRYYIKCETTFNKIAEQNDVYYKIYWDGFTWFNKFGIYIIKTSDKLEINSYNSCELVSNKFNTYMDAYKFLMQNKSNCNIEIIKRDI